VHFFSIPEIKEKSAPIFVLQKGKGEGTEKMSATPMKGPKFPSGALVS